MVGGHGVLPGRAAGRLRLRPSADALRAGAPLGDHPSRRDGRGACFSLPLSIATGWGRPPAVGEAFWLLGLFAVSIGLPFFALSANAPLLQAWFARTDHPSASDPYFLYAASNVGSFLALLSYPILIEPFIRLSDQTWLWSVGFVVLIPLIAGCGDLLWRSPARLPDAAEGEHAEAAPPTWRDAATWMALAAVPSGLLVAVTAHISTDVAAVPLLWVIPLALYLLTFVIVFSRAADHSALARGRCPAGLHPRLHRRGRVRAVQDHRRADRGPPRGVLRLPLMCHGELARRRPAARYLTAFYLWMSFGGMIGGIAAGLVAPHMFNWVAEYPILIALAVLCRPGLALPQNLVARIGLGRDDRGGRGGAGLVGQFERGDDQSSFHRIVFGLLIACVLFWRAPCRSPPWCCSC